MNNLSGYNLSYSGQVAKTKMNLKKYLHNHLIF